MSAPPATSGLADAVARIMLSLGTDDDAADIRVADLTTDLIRRLADSIAGSVEASVVRRRTTGRGAESVAGTGASAGRLDSLQLRRGHGPTIEAIEAIGPVVVTDTATDGRWPQLHGSAWTGTAVRSVVSAQVVAPSFRGALTIYSPTPGAFTDADCVAVSSVAAVLGLAFAADERRRQVTNLSIALASNRTIGIAIGIVMVQRRITREAAFEAMTDISMRSHRKVREVAEEVVLTGTLPDPPSRR